MNGACHTCRKIVIIPRWFYLDDNIVRSVDAQLFCLQCCGLSIKDACRVARMHKGSYANALAKVTAKLETLRNEIP